MNIRIKNDNYYGSELNKLVDQECTRLMTAMNIDLIMHKKSKNMIRIIESKHTNESMKKEQRDLLYLLGKGSKRIGAALNISFEVYIIHGDPPYDVARILNLENDLEAIVDRETLIRFLNFELTFEDLVAIKRGGERM